MTILREWRGRADPKKQDAVFEHFLKNVKPKMAASPGFLSASLGRRDLGRVVEFVLVTEWRDLEAVKAFTGSAPEKAVIPEGTSEVLSDYDSFVRLYEIIDHC